MYHHEDAEPSLYSMVPKLPCSSNATPQVRSRETAQATRKRRQLYITRLQKLITELSRNLSCQLSSTEPDNSRRVFSKQRAARCDVVQKFFKYRSEGMANQNTWAKLVEPKFVLTQPPLPFKVYSDFESVGSPDGFLVAG